MKENLLVTLADEKFIDQAKQLFSSAYWNGGWSGDFMLLAYSIPERKLLWFKNKGIFIKRLASPLIKVKGGKWGSNYPAVVLAKLYVFHEDFKKWKHVVFLDNDVIVRANINRLNTIKGFGAVTDMLPFMENQITDSAKITANPEIMKAKVFNSGVFCFSTDIITKDTLPKILALANEYQERTIYYPDQAVLNVIFHSKWRRIPFFFNLYYFMLPLQYRNNPSKIKELV